VQPDLTPIVLLSLSGLGVSFAFACMVIGFLRLPPPPPREVAPPRVELQAAPAAPAPTPTVPRAPPIAPPPPAPPPRAVEPVPAPVPVPAPPVARRVPAPADWFAGLRKTRDALLGRLDSLLGGADRLGPELLDEIETVLFSADLGTRTADDLMDVARRAGSPADVRPRLRERALELLRAAERPPIAIASKPHIILVVGVNGAGKTTTIGKLADRYQREGRTVIVAAADTFRAAAIEQLEVWANRAEAQIVKGAPGSDPASVAFDAVKSARSRGVDIVLIDTAGRLQTDAGLMDQLAKMSRVVKKEVPEAPHEVLLVLDANTGQNAIRQAKEFQAAVQVSSIALTKLDGTAKGGVVLSIAQEIGVPVRYVGIGEGLEDLTDFDAQRFVDALFAPAGSGREEPSVPTVPGSPTIH
jgi:fused signal recognition particle receptor